jgi:hypothetical protein
VPLAVKRFCPIRKKKNQASLVHQNQGLINSLKVMSIAKPKKFQ